MIAIRLLAGPRDGQERTSADIPADVDPVDLLVDLALRRWRWQIDWSTATPAEILRWGLADMVGRVFLAGIEMRCVRFLGRRWDFSSVSFGSPESDEMLGQIENVVSDSGRNVYVLDDDPGGDFIIGVRGYETGFEPNS